MQQMLADGDERGCGDLTLEPAFKRFVLPDLIADGAEKSTIEEYWLAARHWTRRTGNPRIHSATKADVSELRLSMIEDHLARGTIDKTSRHLNAIFRRLAPKTDANPDGRGVIAERLRFRPLKHNEVTGGEGTSQGQHVSRKQFLAMYEACASLPLLRGPGRTRTPDIWRCLLVMFWFYGPSTLDLIRLRRLSILLTPQHPSPRVRIKSPCGWLRFRRKKTGVQVCVPILPTVLDHLLPVLECSSDRLFPIPQSKRGFYYRWRPIRKAAGGVVPKDLRVTCNTYWEGIFPGLGTFVLGQRGDSVNARHYRAYLVKMIRRAHRFPFPGRAVEALLRRQVAERRCVAQATRRSEWQFRAGRATCGDFEIRLPPRPLAILQALVAAGSRPSSLGDLERSAFFDSRVSAAAIKGAVHRLRCELVKAFRLPAACNPIAWDSFSGRGWLLTLPPDALEAVRNGRHSAQNIGGPHR
jgi:hypothetical protein